MTGNEAAFCAGGDVRTMGETDPVKIRERMECVAMSVEAVATFPKILIGAVAGHAAGGNGKLSMRVRHAGRLVVMPAPRRRYAPEHLWWIGRRPASAFAYGLSCAAAVSWMRRSSTPLLLHGTRSPLPCEASRAFATTCVATVLFPPFAGDTVDRTEK